MPIPIGLVSGQPEKPENNSFLDASFLMNYMPTKEAGLPTKLADKDAADLMKIWLSAKKIDNETFEVKNVDLDNNTLIRLKSRGLISGGTEKIKFTSKAKTVISTMALGENNDFLKNKKEKSYTEILASMDKRGKKGYRIAMFDEHSHLLNLAQNQMDDNYKTLQNLMNGLHSHFGKGVVSEDRYPSFEMMDEAMGTCWIAVAYIDRDDIIYIEKYYENETLNDSYGRVVKIPYSENAEAMQQNVIQVIESMRK